MDANNSNAKLFYWVARISSIIISYIAIAFFTEATFPTGFVRVAIAILIGLLGTMWVLYNTWQKAQPRLLAMLPFGYWLGLSAYYLLGGFPQLTIVQYLYLSILAGSLTLLSYYAWENYFVGGMIYIGLGLFYLFIAFNRVQVIGLLFVIGFLWQTGTLFLLVDPDDVFPEKKLEHELPPQENANLYPIQHQDEE